MAQPKISSHQLFALTVCVGIGPVIILVPALAATMAKQDAWSGALLTPAYGILVIWMYYFLGSQYPSMTLVDILKTIFGKYIGSIAAFSFIFLWFHTLYSFPWHLSNFITTQSMPETPNRVINMVFVIVIVVAEYYGIETIGRFCELALYFILILFFLSMLLVLPNVNIENLLPVFEKGITPIFNSSMGLSCYITFPAIVLMMIYPFNINNLSEAKKSLFKGYLLANVVNFITILISILVLGSGVVASYQYPTYTLVKEINVFIIFSRFEAGIAAIWISSTLIISMVFFHAVVIGFSQLFGLKNYKIIVIPLGIIILVMSEVIFPNITYEANWAGITWVPYIITHGLIIPILLIIVHLIKKWVFKKV